MKMSRPHKNERGAALVISLMFLSILAMLGTTAVVLTTTDIKIGANYKANAQAFYDADAGVAFAVGTMEAGLADGSFSLPTTVGGTSTLTYSVPSGFSFSISDVTMIATNAYSLTSTGTDPGNTNSWTDLAVIFEKGSAITMAAFGDKKMEMKNSAQVYSYDSRTSSPATGLGNSSGQGDIGSNENVITKNASVIDGDGVFGAYADGSPTTNTIFDTNDFAGDAPVDAGRIEPDPLGINSGGEYDPTTYAASNDNADAVSPIVGNFIGLGSSYTSSTMTLPGKAGGANYYITAIDLKNSTTLTIDTTLGPVRLFMDDPSASSTTFSLSNGAAINVIPPANADQFGFFTNYTGSLDVKNSGDFNGLIYAPKADVIIRNSGDVNGAIWGETVEVKNSGILNYNTALADRYTTNDLIKTSWNNYRN